MLTLFIFASLCSQIQAEEYKVTDQVFLDVAIGEQHLGRITIGLFGEVVPKTVKNFKIIAASGLNGSTYAGTKFHRVIKRFMIQGGDIVSNNGTGSISIYGTSFPDENFIVKHRGAGFVSMANSGFNTNGCQFFITTIQTPWLDGKHTAFGRVVEGQDIVHKIEQVKTNSEDGPLIPVIITSSGSVPTSSPFYVSDEYYNIVKFIRAGSLPLGFSFAILGFFFYVIRKLQKYEKVKLHTL